MEKERVREVIRREGLIIIVFVLLFLVVRWLEENRRDQISAYIKSAEVVGVYSRTDLSEPEEYITKSGARYSISRISEFTGVSVMFPDDTVRTVMTATLQRDYPDIKNIDPVVGEDREARTIDRFYDREGIRLFNDLYYRMPLGKIGLFLVLAYPFSLFVRVIHDRRKAL